jgi:hypothetical protein
MSSDENTPNAISIGQKRRHGALQLGARKKPCAAAYEYQEASSSFSSSNTDPLVHHGRHFGRTVHALCTISALLNNGLLRMREHVDQPDDAFADEYVFRPVNYIKDFNRLTREHREHRVFDHLLHMIPGLRERLMEASTEEIVHIGELVSRTLYYQLVYPHL